MRFWRRAAPVFERRTFASTLRGRNQFVYVDPMSEATIVKLSANRRYGTEDSAAGVKNGAPRTTSRIKNQRATAPAPMSPVMTPRSMSWCSRRTPSPYRPCDRIATGQHCR